MTADTTGRVARRPSSPVDDPRVALQLRRIAVHQETVALLELRAQQAASTGDAALLRRRAAERRALAQQLRTQLAAEQTARPAS